MDGDSRVGEELSDSLLENQWIPGSSHRLPFWKESAEAESPFTNKA